MNGLLFWSLIDDKAGYALRHGYLVIYKSLPKCILLSDTSVAGRTMHIFPRSTIISKYGHFWLPNTKMEMTIMATLRLQNGPHKSEWHHVGFTLGWALQNPSGCLFFANSISWCISSKLQCKYNILLTVIG